MDKTPKTEEATRLTKARTDRGFADAKAAADFFGWNYTTYSQHERGERGLRKDVAAKYAAAFRVSPAWLLTGELDRVPPGHEFGQDPEFDDGPTPADTTELAATVGEHTGRRGIPPDGIAQIDVTGGMGGGGITIVSDGVPGKAGMTFAAEHVRDYWRLPHEVTAALGLRPGDIAIIPVQGDSMGDTLSEGDYVFIDTRHRLPSPDGLYALTDEFGGIIVKRLEVVHQPRAEDILVRIISDNPKHGPKERFLTEMNIIGRVVRRFGVVG